MKTVLVLLILALALLSCGCTSTAPQAPATPAPPAAAAVPDLTGTWTGPSEGYDEGTGFTDYRDLDIAIVVTEQKGRIFAGRIEFLSNGTRSSTGFAGAISRDGKTFVMSERAGGYCFGEITGPDAVEITYAEDGSPYSIAIDSFTRQK